MLGPPTLNLNGSGPMFCMCLSKLMFYEFCEQRRHKDQSLNALLGEGAPSPGSNAPWGGYGFTREQSRF